MKLQFKITVKNGIETRAEYYGREKDDYTLDSEDVAEKIIETEQFLERLTGLRHHIQQV